MKQTLHQYLMQYRSVFKKRSFDIFYWLIMGILCTEEVRSIQIEALTTITVSIALSLIPEKLRQNTLFITIDDTLQAKYGAKFDCYAKHFDHTKKNGTKYLNGHCFVSVVLNIPLYYQDKAKYLSIPIGYRLYSKEQNKLEMASQIIKCIMPQLEMFQVILLCDSWYSKGSILDTVKEFDNLKIIGAVRHDTAIYDLPPAPTGKRGRPRKRGRPKKRGRKLNTREFSYTKIGKYYVAEKKVMANLFEKPIYVTVTTTDIKPFSSIRVFISSINPDEIKTINTALNTKGALNDQNEDECTSKTLTTYRMRWNIEVMFYQHKFFWSFGNYMVRNKAAIERYVNLLFVAYTFACLLPFMDKRYEKYQFKSPQLIKRTVGVQITKELIFDSFVLSFESAKIYSTIKESVQGFLNKDWVA
ncbi:IS701 family transposase [Alkaliphilus metalliredigens]|nr:transposase [Alkaliphilus metalliredigens]